MKISFFALFWTPNQNRLSRSHLAVVFQAGQRVHDELEQMEEDVRLLHKLVLQHHQVHQDVTDRCHGVLGVDHLELGIIDHVEGLGDVGIILGLGLLLQPLLVAVEDGPVVREVRVEDFLDLHVQQYLSRLFLCKELPMLSLSDVKGLANLYLDTYEYP